MRLLIQEVSRASVSIAGKEVASIGKGYLIFSSFTGGDDEEIVRKMCEKMLKLRVWPDENGKTNLSLSQVGGRILSVSQFTLYADLTQGNRPSFTKALAPAESKPLYEFFNDVLRKEFDPDLPCGVFGADMQVSLVNEGPFTLWLDSKEILK